MVKSAEAERQADRAAGSTERPSQVRRAVAGGAWRQGSQLPIDKAGARDITPILDAHADIESTLQMDEAKHYIGVGRTFAKHEQVKHKANEWIRGTASTNSVEGFFSIFKKGMRGVYKHCDERHLARYLAKFDFRYNNRTRPGVSDSERTAEVLKASEGRRLTYRRTGEGQTASLG
jgi:hypothetical protein